MPLSSFVAPNAIIPSLRATSKKQALQEIAEKAAQVSGLRAREVFEALLQRERLGSTGTGNGIAIPHCQLPRVGRIFGVFARLERGIDYDALDGAPVDLIFLLVAPESAGADHLKALSQIARTFRDPGFAATLRATSDPAALYTLLTADQTSHAA